MCFLKKYPAPLPDQLRKVCHYFYGMWPSGYLEGPEDIEVYFQKTFKIVQSSVLSGSKQRWYRSSTWTIQISKRPMFVYFQWNMSLLKHLSLGRRVQVHFSHWYWCFRVNISASVVNEESEFSQLSWTVSSDYFWSTAPIRLQFPHLPPLHTKEVGSCVESTWLHLKAFIQSIRSPVN